MVIALGPGKQGAGFGHTKIQGKSVLIRGLNALAAVVSTPLAAPVIAATRLRAGTTNSARGADTLITEAIGVAGRAGASGDVMVRGDSAFYSAACVHACLRQGAFFSFTMKMDPKVKAAIAAIAESAWTPIKYPNAIFDEESGTWVSNAEVAEIGYTAFASKKNKAVTARLIVRRVRRLDNAQTAGQQELLPAWRYHAVFTNNPYTLLQAEAQHRDDAIIEGVFADLADGPPGPPRSPAHTRLTPAGLKPCPPARNGPTC